MWCMQVTWILLKRITAFIWFTQPAPCLLILFAFSRDQECCFPFSAIKFWCVYKDKRIDWVLIFWVFYLYYILLRFLIFDLCFMVLCFVLFSVIGDPHHVSLLLCGFSTAYVNWHHLKHCWDARISSIFATTAFHVLFSNLFCYAFASFQLTFYKLSNSSLPCPPRMWMLNHCGV